MILNLFRKWLRGRMRRVDEFGNDLGPLFPPECDDCNPPHMPCRIQREGYNPPPDSNPPRMPPPAPPPVKMACGGIVSPETVTVFGQGAEHVDYVPHGFFDKKSAIAWKCRPGWVLCGECKELQPSTRPEGTYLICRNCSAALEDGRELPNVEREEV